MKILGVIPARYESSRFPGKPLALIDGIPMIKRTYLQAVKSNRLNQILVATDDARIFNYCEQENIPVTMTSSTCLTGTDRLVEVSQSYDYDFYVNIQGDEPIIDPECIEQLVSLYEKTDHQYEVYNLYKVITDETEINSPLIIKVVVNERDETMYMSRLPIPFSNGHADSIFKQQIPVYGFTKKALKIFAKGEKTQNEIVEDIELLRFVDLDFKIKMQATEVDSIAVDIPSDITKVESYLKSHALGELLAFEAMKDKTREPGHSVKH
ncbi:MAG: 3-deoxy-manno-octulosonate cytidylyltransferase [Pseudomonadales bacterium]|nr:3-deoxy-manno-octulosonate cytidylyltransferase [Pseudomonadales bacterium]